MAKPPERSDVLDQIEKMVNDTPLSDYEKGIHAYFKTINDKWGLKFYWSRLRRDDNYDRQMRAYKVGCAPALGDKFEIPLPNNQGIAYGYVTEKIRKTWCDRWKERYAGDIFRHKKGTKTKVYQRLIKKLQTVMSVDDMHGKNVGYLANGKLVAIDFSCCDDDGCSSYNNSY